MKNIIIIQCYYNKHPFSFKIKDLKPKEKNAK
jgi:hypothetical protein